MHQRILRYGFPPGRHFDDDVQREAYVSRVLALMEQARRRGHRYVVGVGETFTTHDGQALSEGDEVIPEQVFRFIDEHTVGGTHRMVPVWAQLEAAIRQSRIIDSGYEPPRAA